MRTDLVFKRLGEGLVIFQVSAANSNIFVITISVHYNWWL